MRYRCLLFDVGETLIGPSRSYGAVYSRVLGGLGRPLPAERLERCIREEASKLARSLPPGADRFGHYPGGEQEYWMRFAGRVLREAGGREVEPEFLAAALDGLRGAFGCASAWTVYDDVVPTLQGLREEGFRLGVVSNWDSRLPAVLRALELEAYFEVIGVSHLEGVEKPHPGLFRRVLERLGAGSREALHVGNVPELDLDGARAAGIDAVLVDRNGSLAPSFRAMSDFRDLPGIARTGSGPALWTVDGAP